MSLRIALLIDAENISYREIPHILKQASRQGQIVLQAVYGDWEHPGMQTWRDIAIQHNFKIRHQTNDPLAKNSADMKLIMDAMEIVYRVEVDGFCLVTNDADYIALCDKIHELKKYVIGVGYPHAAETLIRACDQFIFVGRDNPNVPAIADDIPDAEPQQFMPITQAKIEKIINKAFEIALDNTEQWVTLSALGSALRQVETGFSSKDYGHTTLSKLLQKMPNVVVLRNDTDGKSARLNKLPAKPSKLQKIVIEALALTRDETGHWLTLSTLGTAIRQVDMTFDTADYGYPTLTKLLLALPDLVELQVNGNMTSARLKK